LLTDMNDYVDTSNKKPLNAFENLRSGQWVLLCGPHPASNAYLDSATNTWKGEPRFFMNWYQVLSIDSQGSGVIDPYTQKAFDPTKQRVVALRGPQWPWQPSSVSASLANDLCVGICKGAVAVHTKTMRLEGSGGWGAAAGSGGADAAFGNSG